LQYLRAGPGWGVLEDTACPKPVWHALAQVLQPLQVLITDEGLNGLALHVVNETPQDVRATLALSCLRDGAVPVAHARRALELPPHSATTVPSFELLGRFFDITAAYRFGRPEHDVTIATLTRQDEEEPCAMAAHFPEGPALPPRELGISVEPIREGDAWILQVRAERFAQFVHVVDPHYRARPDWFHLPPRTLRRVHLFRNCDATALPSGDIVAINGCTPQGYSARA
jgi:beta-mannosidase